MRKHSYLRGLLLTAIVFALLFLTGNALIDNISRSSGAQQTEIVRSAIRSAVVTCYAIEGCYPSDLAYLKENYGLAYDEETYLVYYDAFASNIMPDVVVAVRGDIGQ